MTDKMFEQEKRKLREEMNANGFGWINGNYIKPPKEYETIKEKLNCINMINSILAYDWFGEDAEWVMEHEEKSYHNYLAEYVEMFGRDKVISWIQEQINDIKMIKRGVHTDSEGLTYNSIVWADEQ